jgi:hypothetical protein
MVMFLDEVRLELKQERSCVLVVIAFVGRRRVGRRGLPVIKTGLLLLPVRRPLSLCEFRSVAGQSERRSLRRVELLVGYSLLQYRCLDMAWMMGGPWAASVGRGALASSMTN